MTEILVAIGIIVLLIAITLPVVSKVRRAAQRADSQQQLSSIGAAIERYQADFRAYPGPLSNDEIGQADPARMPQLFMPPGTAPMPDTDKITMAENLVLGLLGGLRRAPGTGGNPGPLVYDFTLVGGGPGQLNPRQPKKFSPYAEPIQLSWTDSQPSTGGANAPSIPSGYYVDDASLTRGSQRMDSPIPEFVDRFTNPMPILYLRARVAAPGVISDVVGLGTAPFQYDINQITGYTAPVGTESIGVGKDIERGDYKPTLAAGAPLYHGISGSPDETSSNVKGQPNYVYPFNAFPYFQDPTIRPTDPNNLNATGTPRKKNGFILISAGPDRVYGTYDDMTNFGDVAP